MLVFRSEQLVKQNRAKLRELRLQQRAEVASSALLDHAGLARSLATSSESGGDTGFSNRVGPLMEKRPHGHE